MTESDAKKIEEEAEHRKLVVRKEAIEAVKEARAQGDSSENSEHYAAKKDKGKNESRIHYLERILRAAHIVSGESQDGEVGLSSTVELYIEEDDETETYRLATSVRDSSLNGLISTEPPIGKVILRHKVGDRAKVKVSDNYSYYAIIKSTRNTEEDENDKVRSF